MVGQFPVWLLHPDISRSVSLSSEEETLKVSFKEEGAATLETSRYLNQ